MSPSRTISKFAITFCILWTQALWLSKLDVLGVSLSGESVKVGMSGVGFKTLIPQEELGVANFILIVDCCAGGDFRVIFCFSISYIL